MAKQPRRPLLEEAAPHDPFALFANWYTEAQAVGMVEPAAMSLATATVSGTPSVRIVLLRGYDRRGFVFFTNYLSRKAKELAANPQAALLLHWAELERQVRVEGSVAKVSAEESDAYFRGRPLGNQLGALAFPQGQVISNRDILEKRLEELAQQYHGQEVPRPGHWGGYRLEPHTFEFWQGRENRLHDRLRFILNPDGSWLRERLAP